jgi:hypothetical protein
LIKEYHDVSETILNNEPFIKKDIYDSSKSILDEASRLIRYVNDNGTLEDGMNAGFDRLVETVKAAIRKYIRNEPSGKKQFLLFFNK